MWCSIVHPSLSSIRIASSHFPCSLETRQEALGSVLDLVSMIEGQSEDLREAL
jgi:hypothetical protein